MDGSFHISLGLEEEFKYTFVDFCNVVRKSCDSRVIVGSGNNNTFFVFRDGLSKSINVEFLDFDFIGDSFTIVGVLKSSFEVVFLKDDRLIKTGVFLYEENAKKVHISKVSNKLVFGGKGIFVYEYDNEWKLRLYSSFFNDFPVKFKLNSEKDLIIMYGNENTQFYSLNGELITEIRTGRFDNMAFTIGGPYIVLYNQDSIEIFDVDSHSYKDTITPISNVIKLWFIDTEHLLIYSKDSMFYLFNIHSLKFFRLQHSLPPISDVYFFIDTFPSLIVMVEKSLHLLKIMVPWRFWSRIQYPIHSLERYNLAYNPAQIIGLSPTKEICVFSSKSGKAITRIREEVLSYSYERSLNFMVVVSQSDISLYNFAYGQMVFVSKKIITSKHVVLSHILNSIMILNNENSIEVYDYFMGNKKQEFKLGDHKCAQFFEIGDHIILICEDGIYLYNPINCIDLDCIRIPQVSSVKYFNTSLCFSNNEGTLFKVDLGNDTFNHDSLKQCSNKNGISSISISKTFIVCSSKNGVVSYYNNDLILLAHIHLHIPILSCLILNGYRDVIVSTNDSLMVIPGSYVFHTDIDEEDIIYDNFNKLESIFLDSLSFSLDHGSNRKVSSIKSISDGIHLSMSTPQSVSEVRIQMKEHKEKFFFRDKAFSMSSSSFRTFIPSSVNNTDPNCFKNPFRELTPPPIRTNNLSKPRIIPRAQSHIPKRLRSLYIEASPPLSSITPDALKEISTRKRRSTKSHSPVPKPITPPSPMNQALSPRPRNNPRIPTKHHSCSESFLTESLTIINLNSKSPRPKILIPVAKKKPAGYKNTK